MTRKVDRLSCVRFGSARYSVPTRLIGTTVTAAWSTTARLLVVIEPATGEMVAEHELVAPGETSHRRRALRRAPPGSPAARPRPRTSAEKEFCALGPAAEAFLVGAAAAGNTRLGPELEILLGLWAAHGEAALLAALRRAVAFGRLRAADVRSILAAGTGARSPARPATRWCWTCPPRRPGPWTPTRSRPAVTGAAHDHHNRYENRLPPKRSRICLPI